MLLVLFVGGCQRAVPTTSPTIASIPSLTPSYKTSTATSKSPQPYPQPTTTLVPQSTTGGYPQPSIPVNPPQTEIPYPQPIIPTENPYPAISAPTLTTIPLASATQKPTNTPEPSQTLSIQTSTPTRTQTEVPPYPGPGENQNPSTETSEAYPGPQITDTLAPYLGPETSTPEPTQTSPKALTPTVRSSETTSPLPSPTARPGTPGPTPTELLPRPPLSPPPAGSSVTIWHSWGLAETDALRAIIQSFQRLYPDVTFSLLFVPLDDLFNTYQEAAYLGQGSNLLLGPAKWGPELFDGELISDLSSYVPKDYLSGINSAALSSAEYHKSLISLPLSQHGMVMFRNTTLISTAPKTLDELTTLSHAATHGGVVGTYLERGSYFSAANIIGLGGRLLDENGNPVFNGSFGLEWINLLRGYAEAGAVTFNTNRDLDMFKRGRVGIIIDGSWNISLLIQAIGSDKLAIDPWPAYGTGHMSGWVETDSVFVNANTTDKDRFAALAFIGYLLDPNVQVRLAEVGHIPSVIAAKPRDALIHQAMDAFSSGAPYPIAVDDSVLNLYWKELDLAIRNVFLSGVSPANALKAASDDLVQMLRNLQTIP